MLNENFIEYDEQEKHQCYYCNEKLSDDWVSDFDCNIDYHTTSCPNCGKQQWIRRFKHMKQEQWASEEEEEESIEIRIRELQPNKIDKWNT